MQILRLALTNSCIFWPRRQRNDFGSKFLIYQSGLWWISLFTAFCLAPSRLITPFPFRTNCFSLQYDFLNRFFSPFLVPYFFSKLPDTDIYMHAQTFLSSVLFKLVKNTEGRSHSFLKIPLYYIEPFDQNLTKIFDCQTSMVLYSGI